MVLFLSACSVAVAPVGEPLHADADTGIAVVSVTRTGWRDFDLSLELTGPGMSAPRPIKIFAHSKSRDWTGGPKRDVTPADAPEGRLFALKLAPGTYHVNSWFGTSRNGGDFEEGYQISGYDVGLSFTVVPGTITYVGNVNVVLPDKLNYQANLTPSFYRIETGPKAERDLALLRQRYPGTAADAVRTDPIRFAHAGAQLRYYIYNYKVGDRADRK